MIFRRWMLLLFGIVGGMLAAIGLYISAESILTAKALPPVSIEPSWPWEETLPRTEQMITLPMGVPGTALIAQRMSAYDGPFLEDGSHREVMGVAALLVYNGGSAEVSVAYIALQFGEDTYNFFGENIPAGGMVVLLEQNAKAYREGALTGCTGWQVIAHTGSEIWKKIAVAEGEQGLLEVTNFTDQTLKNVRIYYKSWLSPPDIYVGGISYCERIGQLLPGQRVCIYPGRYAAGYSKVVSVTAE